MEGHIHPCPSPGVDTRAHTGVPGDTSDEERFSLDAQGRLRGVPEDHLEQIRSRVSLGSDVRLNESVQRPNLRCFLAEGEVSGISGVGLLRILRHGGDRVPGEHHRRERDQQAGQKENPRPCPVSPRDSDDDHVQYRAILALRGRLDHAVAVWLLSLPGGEQPELGAGYRVPGDDDVAEFGGPGHRIRRGNNFRRTCAAPV